MSSDLQRITIGFRSQSLPARVAPEQLDRLRSALSAGSGGWHELHAEEGPIMLDLAKVIFLRVDAGDQRVGFGL